MKNRNVLIVFRFCTFAIIFSLFTPCAAFAEWQYKEKLAQHKKSILCGSIILILISYYFYLYVEKKQNKGFVALKNRNDDVKKVALKLPLESKIGNSKKRPIPATIDCETKSLILDSNSKKLPLESKIGNSEKRPIPATIDCETKSLILDSNSKSLISTFFTKNTPLPAVKESFMNHIRYGESDNTFKRKKHIFWYKSDLLPYLQNTEISKELYRMKPHPLEYYSNPYTSFIYCVIYSKDQDLWSVLATKNELDIAIDYFSQNSSARPKQHKHIWEKKLSIDNPRENTYQRISYAYTKKSIVSRQKQRYFDADFVAMFKEYVQNREIDRFDSTKPATLEYNPVQYSVIVE